MEDLIHLCILALIAVGVLAFFAGIGLLMKWMDR